MSFLILFSAALTLLATGRLALAQPTPSGTAPGFLGQRYLEAGAAGMHSEGISEPKFLGALSARLPIAPSWDVTLGYDYGRIKYDLFSGLLTIRSQEHIASLGVTGYRQLGALRPFASVGVGYFWASQRYDFGGVPLDPFRNDDALWAAAVGIEISVGRFVIAPKISYEDAFSTDLAGFLSGTIEGSTWLTRRWGIFTAVRYYDPRDYENNSWSYRLGARLRF